MRYHHLWNIGPHNILAAQHILLRDDGGDDGDNGDDGDGGD